MNQPERKKRRWFRFSLRFLLVLMCLFGCLLGWLVSLRQRAVKEIQVIKKLSENHPELAFAYDYGVNENGGWKSECYPPGPPWLTKIFHKQMFARVHEVMFGDTEDLSDLAAAYELTALKRFSIGDFQGENLDELSGISALENLIISAGPNLKDIEGLRSLKNLNDAGFRGCKKIEDYSVLADLPQLSEISVWGGPIEVETLSGANVVNLQLDMCELSDLKGINQLPRLKKLEIFSCDDLRDFSELASNKTIESLRIHRSFLLRNIDPVWSMTDLKLLSLFGCKRVQSFDGLTKLVGLEELNLGDCQGFSRLELLEELTSLRKLSLIKNQSLTSLEPLAKLKKLVSLDVSYCENLVQLNGVLDLPSLKTIRMRGCSGIGKQQLKVFRACFPDLEIILK